MNCPVCDARLPGTTTFLAETARGTQCPHCWTHLHNLAPDPEEPLDVVGEEPPQVRLAHYLREKGDLR